jgi:predicted secreted protein
MAAAAGRKLRIKYDADGAGGSAAVVFSGELTSEITWNLEPIDITDKDDDGIVTYEDDIGTKQLVISATGVLIDSTLMELAENATDGAALHAFEVQVDVLRTYTGSFFITSFAATGNDGAEAMQYNISLSSSGTVTGA